LKNALKGAIKMNLKKNIFLLLFLSDAAAAFANDKNPPLSQQ